jgi:hypothetical protein
MERKQQHSLNEAIKDVVSGVNEVRRRPGWKEKAEIDKHNQKVAAKERRARVDETPFEEIYSALQKNTDWIGYLDEMYGWKWFGPSSILEDIREDIQKTGVYDKVKANKAYRQILDEQNKIRKERLDKIKEEEKNLTKNIGEIKKLMR